ncbi:hypothetical protein PTMSG1_09418 [Pyrenophora teres f. maculata]|nr:hypothetical protein PTMSG1_09418 [Pyrenophora teres f. maculata]
MYNTKSQNAQHIFVKNVPGDLAREGIPRLFHEYKPTAIKNIYPNSSVTTVVLTFRSPTEAIRAKEGGHEKRLGNAVLRTEMYEDRRSIRFNRGQGQAKGKANAKEEDEAEDAEEAPEPAPTYTIRNKPRAKKSLVAAKKPTTVTGDTWATIASKPRIEERSEFTDLPTTSSPKTAPADVSQTGTTSAVSPNCPLFEEENSYFAHAADLPSSQLAEQASDADDEDSDESPYHVSQDISLVTVPDTAPDTAQTTPEKRAGKPMVGNSEQEKPAYDNAAFTQPPINISFAYDSNARSTPGPSQILDTTARIRAKHQSHCAFCAMRSAV